MENLGAAPLSRSAERGKEEEESEAKKPRLGEKESSSSSKEEYEFQWEDCTYIKADVSHLSENDDDHTVSLDDPSQLENDDQREQYSRYLNQVIESEGFDVNFTPNFALMGAYRAVDLENDEKVWDCLNFALNDNNQKPKRPKLHNPALVYATRQFASGFNYCITFRAENMDSTGEPATTYQTRVYYDWMNGPQEVLIFRPKISG
ncbi:hypothetical protein Tsubulata_005748 [Turnera subulata]|uniref:Cystatin domain-containing protein n=1 Tax=Turnera subulata TaxID=218843 RepID=A0A9Q0JLS2_9ROSI|nr:hypothetical protein Tsubulata_005748 [Turnera subulata]